MKKIAVLLSTYNGEKYLAEQINSLYNQSYTNFEIIARDDGSSDCTLLILKSYNIKIIDSNKNLGAKKSFIELLKYSFENTDAEYFMFCDQDDVWKTNKIEKTLIKMQEIENEFQFKPILVHSNLEVVNNELKKISNSLWEYEQILPQYNSFNRLMMQNTITGCTVMINRRLAAKSLFIPNSAIMHDWWIGLIASKFGVIRYLNDSTILYRQHNNNTIGAKNRTRINIIKFFLSSCFNLIRKDKEYMNHLEINFIQSKAFLDIFKEDLESNTINMIESFINIKKSNFFNKRLIILKYKLFKQNLNDNISLLIKI